MSKIVEPYPNYIRAGQAGSLNVFMPLVHALRAQGVAASLKLGGHRLWMSGETSQATIRGEIRVNLDTARHWGENTFIYENDEIFQTPPDIIVIGREDLEEDALKLCSFLSKIKPVAIVAYSGCFQSRFNWSAYRGHICTDLPSRLLARYNDVPTLRYREMFDPSQYPFVPWKDEGVFALRSFINGLEERFPLAAEFHARCVAAIKEKFGESVLVENIDGKPPSDVRALINSSAAILHIKDQEGFGWAVLEGLSTGRPLITQEGLSKNMAHHDWVEEGLTGLSFRTVDELVTLVQKLFEDREFLKNLQAQSAEICRLRFDGQETALDLVQFVEDLVRLEKSRWMPNRPALSDRRSEAMYVPSLDPNFKQDYEFLWDNN